MSIFYQKKFELTLFFLLWCQSFASKPVVEGGIWDSSGLVSSVLVGASDAGCGQSFRLVSLDVQYQYLKYLSAGGGLHTEVSVLPEGSVGWNWFYFKSLIKVFELESNVLLVSPWLRWGEKSFQGEMENYDVGRLCKGEDYGSVDPGYSIMFSQVVLNYIVVGLGFSQSGYYYESGVVSKYKSLIAYDLKSVFEGELKSSTSFFVLLEMVWEPQTKDYHEYWIGISGGF
jgi:hypothetical protein